MYCYVVWFDFYEITYQVKNCFFFRACQLTLNLTLLVFWHRISDRIQSTGNMYIVQLILITFIWKFYVDISRTLIFGLIIIKIHLRLQYSEWKVFFQRIKLCCEYNFWRSWIWKGTVFLRHIFCFLNTNKIFKAPGL